jgi:hypothetical protein
VIGDNRLESTVRYKQRLSPGTGGEPLLHKGGRRSRIKFWAVFRDSEYFGWGWVGGPLLSSLSRDARAGGWCWRIKKGIAEPLSPEMGTKPS